MKIKRFFAEDIRQAIRLVREELGADAVILSNRSVTGGIEIVAAIDYDEALLGSMATTAQESQQRQAEPLAGGQDSQTKRSTGAAAQGKPALRSVTARDDDADAQSTSASRSSPAGKPAAPSIVWAQEPALVEMRSELKNLRGLLEEQLSGLAWGDLARRYPRRAKMLRRLMELGLSTALCQRVADVVSEDTDFERAFRHGLALLAHQLPVTDDDILTRGGVVALVGPTGVGKTTTIAKLAARYALRHGPNRVALVTTDSYRIGAHEQLRIYGRILGVPVRIAADPAELRNTLQGLRDKQLVLIDTAGMSQRDVRLSEQFAMLNQTAEDAECQSHPSSVQTATGTFTPAIKTYLVLAATSPVAGLAEIVNAFQGVPLSGCILTKLDEATSLGGALSVAIEQQLPIAYVSNGQRVPEDMLPARAHSLIIRSVTAMQHTGESIEEESLELAFGGMVANAGV
ncbi:MAG TPA: flagellar biosynthesis protein FlhF [Gammaproteobacteria bacterium]|nr:flagellar biosynthesis protein FlhF [Gammaproteobacteria bacterium]